MPKLSLSLPGDITATVKSNNDNLVMRSDEVEMLLGAYLPGHKILAEDPREPDILVEHHQSDDNRLFQQGDNAVIYQTWGKKLPLDIYHILYTATRAKLIEVGLYPLHAACVEDENGDQILLVGHTGSGKSSTALELVNQGMKMVSGNKTVVKFDEKGEMRTIAGTPTMTIRQSDRSRFEPIIGKELSYYDRLAFELDEAHRVQEMVGKIRAIVQVRLQDDPQLDEAVNPLSGFHGLYHFFLDVMYSHATVSNIRGVYITNSDHDKIDKLADKLGEALKKIPHRKMFGPIPYVTDCIQQMKSKNYGQA